MNFVFQLCSKLHLVEVHAVVLLVRFEVRAQPSHETSPVQNFGN